MTADELLAAFDTLPDAWRVRLPGWTPGAGTVVFDMVYQPRLTRLLRDAAAAGAMVVPGIEMFLGQAAAQARLFTGSDVEPATLRNFLAGTAATAAG